MWFPSPSRRPAGDWRFPGWLGASSSGAFALLAVVHTAQLPPLPTLLHIPDSRCGGGLVWEPEWSPSPESHPAMVPSHEPSCQVSATIHWQSTEPEVALADGCGRGTELPLPVRDALAACAQTGSTLGPFPTRRTWTYQGGALVHVGSTDAVPDPVARECVALALAGWVP